MPFIRPRRFFSVTVLVLLVPFLAAGCGSDGAASADGVDESRATETAASPASVERPEAVVYKSPTCGCCEGWVEHLEAEGFDVEVQDRTDLNEVKDLFGIPGQLRSCHTAEIGNYLVEGHVPASDIDRLLEENPEVAGIAVPGMPVGSPGMEVPGRAADRYQVLTFDADGGTEVFATH